MEWGKQMEKHQENAKLSLYQNTNYSFERRERQTLIIDHIIGTTISKITLPLYEPLIIDRLSDIYLDSFTTWNAFAGTSARVLFVLSIDEFNLNSNSNKYSTGTTPTPSFRKIIIPNEAADIEKVVVHKGKKMNYICSINPTKLNQLTIQLTDLSSPPATMFNDTNGRIFVEFIIVARDKE